MTGETANLMRTPLNDLHVELGGKMVPFAGYAMAVHYSHGILKEHHHTRTRVSLFDVSHMGQFRLHGAAAAEAMERLVPIDVMGLPARHQRYALFTNEAGGILDDLMVTNAGDHLFLVVNAACKDEDFAHLRNGLASRCGIEELPDRALLAVQGPGAPAALAALAPEAAVLVFMTGAQIDIGGVVCFVTRSGYTGEDGFEISVPAARAEDLARKLLAQDGVAPAGLGARDTLRLEAGLCLYGNDIDSTTTPVEASLVWALSKAPRADGSRPGGFPGDAVILRQIAEGVARKRVGLCPEGRVPARDGAELIDEAGRVVGKVTSGLFGPTVGGPVAMGYVETAFAKPDTELRALVRGKPHPIRVVRLPFVQHHYHRG
jgi:aminomethyltransferase